MPDLAQPPQRLTRAIAGQFPMAEEWSNNADGVSSASGAYILLVSVAQPVRVSIGKRARQTIGPGWYIYAGSANGPGGIAARVRRHLRKAKRQHWHIDRLTSAPGTRVWACALPGADECMTVDALLGLDVLSVPCPGFGSSDCGFCPSHLLGWDGS